MSDKQYSPEEVLNLQSAAYQKGYNEGYQLGRYEEAQQGAVWVKASEYDISKGGMLFYRFNGPTLKSIGIGHFVGDVFHGTNLDVFHKWDWNNLYILNEAGAPVADWAKDYDTLYYLVLPALNKLRHRTDNDTRMAGMGSDIRDTIAKTIAEIKKLPPPISSNEPPFLVQSKADESATTSNKEPVYDSKWVIGRSEERFKELEHKGWDWRSFYNGWIEGRADMIAQVKNIGDYKPSNYDEAMAFAEFAVQKCWFDEEYRLWNTHDETEDPFRFTTPELWDLWKQSKNKV